MSRSLTGVHPDTAKLLHTEQVDPVGQSRTHLPDRRRSGMREHADHTEPSVYLADFGVHLAIKPFVKVAEWLIVPILYAFGTVDEATLGLAILFGGCLARTLYTAGRCGHMLCTTCSTFHDLCWIPHFAHFTPLIPHSEPCTPNATP